MTNLHWRTFVLGGDKAACETVIYVNESIVTALNFHKAICIIWISPRDLLIILNSICKIAIIFYIQFFVPDFYTMGKSDLKGDEIHAHRG